MIFVIDRATAEWLITKKHLISILIDTIASLLANNKVVNGRIVIGSVRLVISKEKKVIIFSNLDYLNEKEEIKYGYIVLKNKCGILDNVDIAKEVFERCLSIIKSRLNNYFIDGSYIHRSYDNGAHTCISGRGTVARQYNLGFIEINKNDDMEAIILLGPEIKFEKLIKELINTKNRYEEYKEYKNNVQKEFGLVPDIKDFALSLTDVLYSVQNISANILYQDMQVQIKEQKDDSIHSYQDYVSIYLKGSQKKIFDSDIIEKSPLRILGPAGSGKTLLMQLLAIKAVKGALESGYNLRCLYLVHNSEMIKLVNARFNTILREENIEKIKSNIIVTTLYDYAIKNLEITSESIIDDDAYEAKIFQYNQVNDAIVEILKMPKPNYDKTSFFKPIVNKVETSINYTSVIMNEISTTIKGQGLVENRDKYIYSEKQLSKLHGLLNQYDREFLFDIFDLYHNSIFNDYAVLDTDDIAITLLSRLRSPLWQMQRKIMGYDYIFIDEAQLFNENERKLFSLLVNNRSQSYLPIVIALDAAQDIYNQFSFSIEEYGLSTITNENLDIIHRSTKEITDLAFFIIQKSTCLFTPEFPDFSKYSTSIKTIDETFDKKPIAIVSDYTRDEFCKYLFKKVINQQKKDGISNIAIICFSEKYWEEIYEYAMKNNVNISIIETRGECSERNTVVLSRPQHIGGQEFSCVILVGLEQGMYPSITTDNIQLQASVEDQCIREIYLSITRAKNRVIVIRNSDAEYNKIINDSIKQKKILYQQ